MEDTFYCHLIITLYCHPYLLYYKTLKSEK